MTGTVRGGIRRIKVCANGGRSRDDHPGVPVTPAEVRTPLIVRPADPRHPAADGQPRACPGSTNWTVMTSVRAMARSRSSVRSVRRPSAM